MVSLAEIHKKVADATFDEDLSPKAFRTYTALLAKQRTGELQFPLTVVSRALGQLFKMPHTTLLRSLSELHEAGYIAMSNTSESTVARFQIDQLN